MKLSTPLSLSVIAAAVLAIGTTVALGLRAEPARAAAPNFTASCLCDGGQDLGSNNKVFSCQCGAMQCVVAARTTANSIDSPQLACK